MEDVLDLYEEEYDPCYPTVCFDEKLVAPEADVRPAEPMEPGQAERVDYEYQRVGTANIFFFVEPFERMAPCWDRVETAARSTTRTAYDRLGVTVYAAAPPAFALCRIIWNTHTAAALYEAFELAEARRILRRVEFHYTPKHGSWLNMAEIEISLFARGCLRVGCPVYRTCASASPPWKPGVMLSAAPSPGALPPTMLVTNFMISILLVNNNLD